MSTAMPSPVYPAAIDRKLRQIRRRQCALSVLRALLLGAAGLAAAMLLAMLIDWWFTLFSTPVRLFLTVAALGTGIVTAVAAAVGPLVAALGLSRAARDADRTTPQMEERWTTVASFVESDRPAGSAIVRGMLRQVTSEAVAMSRLIQPAQVATPKQLQRAALLFATACLLTVLFIGTNWRHNRVLLERFWFPLADITATQLESVSGDLVVPRGEPVELAFRLSGLPRNKALLVLARDGSPEEVVELAPHEEPSGLFTYHVASLDASFRYRVQAGDGRTGWHSVKAVGRPSLADVKLTLTPPAYVDRPVYEKNYLPARVQAIQGSRLRLEMRPGVPLKSFTLRLFQTGQSEYRDEAPKVEQTVRLSADPRGWYRYETILEQDISFLPELVGPHDLTNEDPQKCSIRVVPDREPIARVISPTEEMSVRPDEVVEIKFEAHDDHGISRAELVVYEESPLEGEPPTILSVEEIPLGEQQNAPHVLATAQLDLSKYELNAGSRLAYAVRVSDNRTALEDAHPLTARSNADSRGERESDSERRANDPPAQAGRKAMPRQESKPAADGTPSAAIVASADGAQKPVLKQAAADAAPPAAASPDADNKGENPPGKSEPKDEPAADSSAADAEPNGKPKQAGSDQPATRRAARSPISGETSTAPDAATPPQDGDAAPARRVPEGDRKLAGNTNPPGQQPAASNGSPAGMPTEVPASNTGAAVNDSGVKTKDDSTEEKRRSPPPGVQSSEPEPRTNTPDTPVGAVAGDNNRQPGDKQSRENAGAASGELTAVARRPKMTDDRPGQFTESNRLRLKVEEQQISAAEAGPDRKSLQMQIRERLERIDQHLRPAQDVLSNLLTTVSQSGIADPQIQELKGVDGRLAEAEEIIADLRRESKETPYAFAGLHMVEIGTAQVAPARDRVFAAIREPDVEARANVAEALHRVSRARELLAELLVRYERALREERLADAIEETAKIYEVYVANLHRFLRAQSKPNPNPLQRKMAIVEVDQAYLDRLREVTEMRRDLMAEFARMVGDDPRLLSKYMDLIKRRQTSLRDRLTELHERQEAIATELGGWRRVDEAQREDVWMLAAEVRLQDVAPLAQEISRLEEHITSQFPLSLDPMERTSSAVTQGVKQLAVHARNASVKARRLLRDPFDETVDLAFEIDRMAFLLSELDAALEKLAFEHAAEETTDYVNKRLAESRTLFERIAAWAEIAAHLQARRFSGLAKVDQRQLAFRTELLRIEMDGIGEQLAGEFRGEVPPAVTALADELKRLMEAITFNQAAAAFELHAERLAEAEAQQALALQRFEQAEELFDRIRRQVVEELDKIDPRNPNIADLEDPTLDELLERLEREPDLNALLGLPNRPQNLRVMSDLFASNEGDAPVPSALAQAAEQARRRGEQEQKEARRMRRESGEDDDRTEEEWRQVADAEQAREKLQQKIDELKQRAADPRTDPEDAEKLRQMARQLEQMRRQLADREIDRRQWEELTRSDQMKAVLRAAARGEPLPDSQWNRLMSSLDEGLWQVRRRTPPEEYRRAIEQYHERLRKLMNLEQKDVAP
jgi:hypothetical protein